jgi:hypothetical protein
LWRARQLLLLLTVSETDGIGDGRRGRTDAFDGRVLGIEAADCRHFGRLRVLKNIVRRLGIV